MAQVPARRRSAAQVPAPTAKQRRRAVRPEERAIDPDRSRRQLLDAALDEFATHGYASARVRDIAARAGLSKDLVTYHFGGKEGLYRAVQQAWLERQPVAQNPDTPLADLLIRYVESALSDPRPVRLLAWRELADDTPDVTPDADDLSGIGRRQQDGEIASDIDPATLRLVLLAAATAPVLLGNQARKLFGADPSSAEFHARYTEGLRGLLSHLQP